MKVTTNDIQAWLQDFAAAIEKNKDYLSELDTPIGDGDHGNNMHRGMTEYLVVSKGNEPNSIANSFKVLAMALISKVGGASGPLYGSAFMNMSKAAKDLPEITTTEQLITILTAGFDGIKNRGKAELGDKTMLDVWGPSLTLLKEDRFSSQEIEQLKEQTKDLQAKKGRASYLGERSIGHIDPGAASSALLFQTLLPYLN
ncbi:MAG: dihydroxyacetone kinase subunit DhaL [Enterococcus viikkiensis]|uniref:Dihydroxyacetone kinase subunit DhaL n=1 Tax=Enterococcus viikkiensis TaxID=930854 RepID=A0ABU3FRJ5_9ENTE|nr:dihydroxyacetone kinase subunit DhaL [Enterococcus viikkiensis]MDT2828603.1 dihydroxyacetone kinase subunit DhaL [Enterococcus viikkiensis]